MGKLIQPEDIAFCIFVQRAIFIKKLLEFAVIRIILKVFIVFYDAKGSVLQKNGYASLQNAGILMIF